MAPFAVVALVLTLGWKIGSEFTSNEGAGAKSQFAGNTVNAAAQQVITGKPSAEATGPIDEPKRDSESQTGKIIVASQYISPWYYYTAIPVALLLLAIITIALRRRMVVVKDSQEFDRALKTWAEVITRRRSTPRSIKRFLNRTRYFAMRLRDNEFFADDKTAAKFVDRIKAVFSPDNSAKPTAHNRSELDEAALVALSSIHHLDPKLLLTLGSEDFQESSLDDALLKKIIQKHRESAGQWPPTKESVLAFIELTKGIEVH